MGAYTTIDPATGEQLAQYPEISDAELDDLIGTQPGGVPRLADHAAGAASSRPHPRRRDPP